jgi:hypothetical protein
MPRDLTTSASAVDVENPFTDGRSPRRRKRRPSVARLVALADAGDYRGLWASLLVALPACIGGCGRASRYMTTYTSEFSCGRAGCPKPEGDIWKRAPWKDHVDAAQALAEQERAGS